MDAYLAASQIAKERKSPLFRSLGRQWRLTGRRLHWLEVLAMMKRRPTGRTPRHHLLPYLPSQGDRTYPQQGGTTEHAQQTANHECPPTTSRMAPPMTRSAWMRSSASSSRSRSALLREHRTRGAAPAQREAPSSRCPMRRH